MSKEIIELELKHYGYDQMFSDNFSLVGKASSLRTAEVSANSYTGPNSRSESAIGNTALEGFDADQLQV
jgi:hypothetical protein